MTVTLRDVAAHVGVSPQTVSNVTNGRTARVGEDTRAKVLAAVEALNYRPNMAARRLRKMPTGVLALVIPDLINPYFAEVGRVIVAEAAARGYTVLLDYTNWDREQELLVATGMRPHLIDGLILDAQRLTTADLMANPQAPIVLLGERLYDGPYNHVVIDNVAAARLATEDLIALGRRRIAVIGRQEHPTSNASQMRLQGYLDALDAAGLAVDSRLQMPAFRWRHASGAAAMRALLELPEPPDAVFCFSDVPASSYAGSTPARGSLCVATRRSMRWRIARDLTRSRPPSSSIGRRTTTCLSRSISAVVAREARTGSWSAARRA